MISPLRTGSFLEVDTIPSTQDLASSLLKFTDPTQVPGVIFAKDQVEGRGRQGRKWISSPGESLTMSMLMKSYANHPKPCFVGMAMALAVAELLDFSLKWPNDVLVKGRKIGGILCELYPDHNGNLIPVAGLGLNLNQTAFPRQIESIATSLHIERGGTYVARDLAKDIVAAIETVPEPDSWQSIEDRWLRRDVTPGQMYRLHDGMVARGVCIGSDGELMGEVNGEVQTIWAAESIISPNSCHRTPA